MKYPTGRNHHTFDSLVYLRANAFQSNLFFHLNDTPPDGLRLAESRVRPPFQALPNGSVLLFITPGRLDRLASDRRPCFRRQWRAEITLTRRARYGHDHLTLVLRAPGYFDGGLYIRTRGNAGEDAFLLRQPSRHREGIVVAHLNTLGDLWVSFCVLQMKVFGDKARSRALNFVRPGL